MAKSILVFILLASTMLTAQKVKAVARDYTIAVHVKSSRLVPFCGDPATPGEFCYWYQQLDAVIDGKKYELRAQVSLKEVALLRPGDYQAKVVSDHAKRTYEYWRTYQFLFSDGRTRDYDVLGEDE